MWSPLTLFAIWSAIDISVLANRRFSFSDSLRPHLPVPQADESDSGMQTVSQSETQDVPLVGNGTFDQYIDHNNHELGTFRQRYWYNATCRRGDNAPVIFINSGESSGDDSGAGLSLWLHDRTILGQIASQVGGVMIGLEHRYMGESTPFTYLSSANLSYLTPEQVTADFARITRELKFPFDPDGCLNAPNAPWIHVGGSYAGAFGPYTERFQPGAFWITYASSANVEAVWKNWYFYKPIEDHMPSNCSSDLQAIFEHVDNVLDNGTKEEVSQLKAMFKLEVLEDDDFATQISVPPGAYWLDMEPWSQHYDEQSDFYNMCDAIQGVHWNSTDMDHSMDTAVGLEVALPNYAKWYPDGDLIGTCNKSGIPEWSGPYNAYCMDTHNQTSPHYTNKFYDAPFGLPFLWIQCAWAGANWPSGPPSNIPVSIISRHRTPDRHLNICRLTWPDYDFGNGSVLVDELNAKTGGWDFVGTQRFFWVNGDHDPWMEGSVASDFRESGKFLGNDKVRSIVIPGSFHVSDLYTINGKLNSDILSAQKQILAQIDKWIREFYEQKH